MDEYEQQIKRWKKCGVKSRSDRSGQIS